MEGGGSYTVNYVDTVADKLVLNATSTTHTPVMDVSKSYTMNITLTPLGPNGCSQP
jgi:hypothetical protein